MDAVHRRRLLRARLTAGTSSAPPAASAFVGQPPVVSVPGGQTSVTISAGHLGLLGDSLTFTVQGRAGLGAHRQPDLRPRLHPGLAARRTRPTSPWPERDVADPATRTITPRCRCRPGVRPRSRPWAATAPNSCTRSAGSAVGPTTAPTVTVPGLAAGTVYTPSVRVYPSGHPGAAVDGHAANPSRQNLTLAGRSGRQPSTPSVDANPNTATLVLSFPALPPGPMTAAGPPSPAGRHPGPRAHRRAAGQTGR